MRLLDFFDGAQSETTPTIGNLLASGLVTYPDDATYEATEQGAPIAGNIYFNTTSNLIRYYNGSAWIDLVDDESLQTIINKTIDADNNTILNIEDDNIKVGAGIDVTKLHDGSVDNTEFGHLNGVSSNIQTQLDNKQDVSEKDQPNGYAGLDATGKILASVVPEDFVQFKGAWNAATNTPTLIDGVGNIGDVYRTSVAGTRTLSGSVEFYNNISLGATGGGGTNDYYVNTVVLASTYDLSQATLRLRNFGGHTGNWTLSVFADDGGGEPDETTVLGTATADASLVGSSFQDVVFTFSSALNLPPGTYHVGFAAADATGMAVETYGSPFTGFTSFDGGTTWTPQAPIGMILEASGMSQDFAVGDWVTYSDAGIWERSDYVGSETLNDLNDVNTAGVSARQALVFDGTDWVSGNLENNNDLIEGGTWSFDDVGPNYEITLSSVALILVPGLAPNRNTIQPQTIVMPLTDDTLWVTLNKTNDVLTNLTVNSGQMGALSLGPDDLVIAHRWSNGIEIGRKLFLADGDSSTLEKGSSIPSVSSLNNIGDVDLTTNPPVSGNLLKFDGTDWVPYKSVFQRKFLSANIINVNGNIPDLTFNNLVIGKTYEIKFQAYLTSVSDLIEFRAVHDGNTIARVGYENSAGSGDDEAIIGSSDTFVATATTLTFETAGMGAAGDRLISGSSSTFAVLTEREDLESTGAFS